MNIILNEVVAFRIPSSLKRKLVAYAEAEELRVSSVVRQAIVCYLKREFPQGFQVKSLENVK